MVTDRKFGVEFEIISLKEKGRGDLKIIFEENGLKVMGDGGGYRHTEVDDNYDVWDFKSDSSVTGPNGFEIASPCLRGEEGLESLKLVCDILQTEGWDGNESCGLHIHQEALDFAPASFLALHQLYRGSQEPIDLFTEVRRFSTGSPTYCGMNKRIDSSIKLYKILSALMSDGGRRQNVNFGSFGSKGTIEFRQKQGVSSPSLVLPWTILTQSIMETAKEGKILDHVIREIGELFDFIDWDKSGSSIFKTTKEDLTKVYDELNERCGEEERKKWEQNRQGTDPNFEYHPPSPGYNIGEERTVNFG